MLLKAVFVTLPKKPPLADAGYHAVLIGEAFVKSSNPSLRLFLLFVDFDDRNSVIHRWNSDNVVTCS